MCKIVIFITTLNEGSNFLWKKFTTTMQWAGGGVSCKPCTRLIFQMKHLLLMRREKIPHKTHFFLKLDSNLPHNPLDKKAEKVDK